MSNIQLWHETDVPRDAPGCFAAAQFFRFWPVASIAAPREDVGDWGTNGRDADIAFR
jgi:hypothetical protein